MHDPREFPRDVEVLHQGRWVAGVLRHAYRLPGGSWRAVVQFFDPVVCHGHYMAVPGEEVRPPSS